MTTCNQAALAMGKPYPENCPTCQQGPCKYPRYEGREQGMFSAGFNHAYIPYKIDTSNLKKPTPVRISTDVNDIGYDMSCCGVSVLVDGVENTECCTVDEAQGYVIQGRRDDKGELMLSGNSFLKETIYGDVKIVGLDDEWRQAHANRVQHRRNSMFMYLGKEADTFA